jgi:hypothetical protein
VVVQTTLVHVNFIVTKMVRAQLPEVLHLCGGCGLKAAKAVKGVLQ